MKLTLAGKRDEAENVISFKFKPEEPISWIPGQFMHYKIDDPNSPESMRRFFSISAAPFERQLMLTTKFMPENRGSLFKKDLAGMENGQTIEATGPSGDFIISDPNQELVFIAGGIGVTPFRSMILQMDHDHQPMNVKLLYANRMEDIVFKDEFEAIARRNPGFKIHYFVGEKKIDEQVIRSSVSGLQSPVFYISGPQNMVRVMEGIVSSLGVPDEKIIHDYFPGYSEI